MCLLLLRLRLRLRLLRMPLTPALHAAGSCGAWRWRRGRRRQLPPRHTLARVSVATLTIYGGAGATAASSSSSGCHQRRALAHGRGVPRVRAAGQQAFAGGHESWQSLAVADAVAEGRTARNTNSFSWWVSGGGALPLGSGGARWQQKWQEQATGQQVINAL